MDLGLRRLAARIPLPPRCSKNDSQSSDNRKNNKGRVLERNRTRKQLREKARHTAVRFWHGRATSAECSKHTAVRTWHGRAPRPEAVQHTAVRTWHGRAPRPEAVQHTAVRPWHGRAPFPAAVQHTAVRTWHGRAPSPEPRRAEAVQYSHGRDSGRGIPKTRLSRILGRSQTNRGTGITLHSDGVRSCSLRRNEDNFEIYDFPSGSTERKQSLAVLKGTVVQPHQDLRPDFRPDFEPP